MPSVSVPTLITVDDSHADAELQRAVRRVARRGARAIVLTGDALYAMRLRRQGLNVRLSIDGIEGERLAALDRLALRALDAALGEAAADSTSHDTLNGDDLAFHYNRYTLIPAFMRAVRHVAVLEDLLQTLAIEQLVVVGCGPLADAARLVAARSRVAIEPARSALATRVRQTFARLRAGRATKWVNSDFRAAVLEPGFILVLLLKGWCHRLTRSVPAALPPRAVIVSGDRWTYDVLARLHDDSRPVILAGATQPGRSQFATIRGLVPIEAFIEARDCIRAVAAVVGAARRVGRLAQTAPSAAAFCVSGVSIWPLVRRQVRQHLVIWAPLLNLVRALVQRAARACPTATLLVSGDAPAYNGALVGTARACGIKTIGIQHGMMGEPNGHELSRVDVLATWGAQTASWYAERVPQHATFVVTGNPRFDALAARPRARPAADQLFTVVVCTGFVSEFSVGASEYENLLMLETVLQWANGQSHVAVIHKMHPGEQPEYYEQAGRALGWDPRLLTTIREPILYALLDSADVLVAAYSTTVLESVALGTPAIVFDAMVQRKLLPLDRVPGITIAYSVDEVRRQLDAARTNPPPDRAALRASPQLRAYISELDGGATARVAALVSGAPHTDA